MAEPYDSIVIAVVVLVIVLAVLTFIELKYLRKASRGKRRRTAEKGELPDQAHNAILTGKAISRSLRSAGVFTETADDAIREAEVAYANRNYRVAIDLIAKAKETLKSEKARHERLGDAARLTHMGPSGPEDVTAKEYLQKEVPSNYMQAKFTLTVAEERIQVARTEGRATAQAEEFLATARARFDAEDYAEALKIAVQSRRSADGDVPVPAPPGPAPAVPPPGVPAAETPRPTARACASCGSILLEGDDFCRKCGVKVERPTACAKCGNSLRPDDTFCRKCGAPSRDP